MPTGRTGCWSFCTELRPCRWTLLVLTKLSVTLTTKDCRTWISPTLSQVILVVFFGRVVFINVALHQATRITRARWRFCWRLSAWEHKTLMKMAWENPNLSGPCIHHQSHRLPCDSHFLILLWLAALQLMSGSKILLVTEKPLRKGNFVIFETFAKINKKGYFRKSWPKV
jgi:hypothetical protein